MLCFYFAFGPAQRVLATVGTREGNTMHAWHTFVGGWPGAVSAARREKRKHARRGYCTYWAEILGLHRACEAWTPIDAGGYISKDSS